jgi:carbohydrate-binding DOMON domain-containing protein
MNTRLTSLTLAAALLGLPAAAAGKLTLKDPTGDDNGPGKYVYPTDAVYKKGSFDLTGVTVEKKGDNVEFTASFGADLEDAWKLGSGFSLQMVFIFIDKDGKAGSGHTEGLPGLNIQFAPEAAWEKVVILSPQAAPRLKTEAANKAASLKGDIVVPSRTKGAERTLTGSVKASELGKGDPSQWGYQVVVQSNEGFPAGNDLMTRKVNEYEGQHRFGGGHDGECDPHVIDTLAGSAKGDASEVQAQHDMLKYECAEDGSTKSPATLTMVRQGK